VSRITKSRWISKPLNGIPASMPPYDHPALVTGHTIYPATISQPRRGGDDSWALKSAENTSKIGGQISKGKWRGFPAYTLTLEERATCPTSCRHWRSCYGNKMPWTERMGAGPDLEWRLVREIALLDIDHPDGFAVRLHNLGDFYSVRYVELWGTLLERHSGLNVWGYAARWEVKDDPIAAALVALVKIHWNRFAIRFSNPALAFAECPGTISIETTHQSQPMRSSVQSKLGRLKAVRPAPCAGKASVVSRSSNIRIQDLRNLANFLGASNVPGTSRARSQAPPKAQAPQGPLMIGARANTALSIGSSPPI
jgi:hypothetical protein